MPHPVLHGCVVVNCVVAHLEEYLEEVLVDVEHIHRHLFEAVADREYLNVDGVVEVFRDGGQPEDQDGHHQVQQVEG